VKYQGAKAALCGLSIQSGSLFLRVREIIFDWKLEKLPDKQMPKADSVFPVVRGVGLKSFMEKRD